MRFQGRIISVDVETGGNFLAAPVIPSDLVLNLSFTNDFDETGGALYLGDIDTVLSYDSADRENNIVYLNALTPAGVSADAGTFVGVLPGAEIKWANVETTPGLDTIPVRVPYSMNALIKPGMRDDTTGYEIVGIEKDGSDYVINEVYNKAAVIDGTTIDELPPALLSDGIPPVFSPSVTILPLGVGGLTGTWDPAPQPDIHDPVIYDVYVSATTPVVPSSDNFLTSTGALTAEFSTVVVAGVTTPISAVTPSYMAVWARDSDGLAPSLGGEGSGIPRKADIANLNVGDLYTNTLQTLALWAASVTTDVAFIGQSLRVGPANASHIDIVPSGPNAGLTLFGTNGSTPLIHLDMTIAQLSKFTGLLETDYITAVKMELTGALSKIMSAATLTIASSTISPPSSAPTLSQNTSTRLWAAPPVGFTETGLWWDGTVWWQLVYNTSTFEARVRSVDSAGTPSASVTLADDGLGRDVRGLYVDATNIWVIRRNNSAAGSGVFNLRKFLLSNGSAVLDTGASPVLSYASKYGFYNIVPTGKVVAASFDASNNLVLIDSLGNVKKFNSSLVYQNQFPVGSPGSKVGVDSDSAGNIYTVFENDHAVKKYSSTGTLLYTIGSGNGDGDGQFSYPSRVVVDSSDNLYVVDSNNDRIQKFNSAGIYQSQFGTSGTSNGHFDYPLGLAFDTTGNIFVLDQGNLRVQKFNSSGVYQSQFSVSATLGTVDGMDVDAGNNIYVMSTSGNLTAKYNSSGVLQYTISLAGSVSITTDTSSNVYLGTSSGWKKFDNTGAAQTDPVITGGDDGGFSSDLGGIATDSLGNTYIADATNNRVQKFNSAGVFQLKFGLPGTGNGQFNRPVGIAIDSSNNVYVSDSNNHRVQKFNSSGTYQSQFGTNGTGNGQFSFPDALCIDGSDNLFVSDSGNNRVQKFDSSGTYQLQFGSAGTANGQFSVPSGIAVDGTGNIFVVDSNNSRVQKFTSAGVYSSKFGTSGTGNGQFSTPRFIAIDGSGAVYVSDVNNDRVQKFTSAGVYVSQFGTSGSGTGQMNGPVGLKFDTTGNLYVVDSFNSRVLKYTPTFPVMSTQVANEVSLTVRSQPTLGYDGTNLLVGGVDKTNMTLANTTLAGVVYYNKSTLVYTGTKATLASGDIISTTSTYYVGVGSFDYGGTRLVISGGATVKVYTISAGVLTLDTTYPSWTWDGTVKTGAWDGTNFYSGSDATTLTKYSRFLGATAAIRKFWAEYTFEDGTGLGLTPSPAASLDLVDRRYLNVTVPGPITGTTVTRVFTANGTTQPANSLFYSRGTTAVAGTLSYDTIAVSAANPKTVSDLASGAPGLFKSQAGGFQVDGDGKGTWPLRDDKIPQTLTATASNTTETIIAQFTVPANYFLAGDMAVIDLYGHISTNSALTYRVRIGTTGIVPTDPTIAVFAATPATGTTNNRITGSVALWCLTAGGSGTMSSSGYWSQGIDLGDGVSLVDGAISNNTVNTTVQQIVTITVSKSVNGVMTPQAASWTKKRG